jgi:hypothetical protein
MFLVEQFQRDLRRSRLRGEYTNRYTSEEAWQTALGLVQVRSASGSDCKEFAVYSASQATAGSMPVSKGKGEQAAQTLGGWTTAGAAAEA